MSTQQICRFGEGVTVWLTFSDSTGVLSSVQWTNTTQRTFEARLTRPDGKTFDINLAPGDGNVATPSQNARRYSYRRGSGSGDADPNAWVSDFQVNVRG